MRNFLSLCLGFSLTVPALGQDSLAVLVEAGDHDRVATTLLSVDLPADVGAKALPLLVPLDAGGKSDALPAQVIPGPRPRLVWLLEQPLAAGASRRYRLDWSPPGETSPGMRCEETDAAIAISNQGKPVLRYVKIPTPEAEANDPLYTRTGYIHPLFTPSGKVVTGDYPADHPHQHALFNAWTKTTFEGRPVNFWDQKGGGGRITHADSGAILSGPVFAQFTVTLRHDDPTAPGRARPVLDETWVVRAYQTGDGFHLFDLESSQQCASASPLVIEKYHYGGMAFRGTSDWFNPAKDAPPPAHFLTSEGQTRLEGNHSRPHWVSLSGPIDGGPAGIAIFSHPENFRSPQWVRLHPTKPYFVFTPMVEEGFVIAPDDPPFVGRYRYLIHDGEADPQRFEQIWNDYAHPPKTRIDPLP